jgi:hypothetical protein
MNLRPSVSERYSPSSRPFLVDRAKNVLNGSTGMKIYVKIIQLALIAVVVIIAFALDLKR